METVAAILFAALVVYLDLLYINQLVANWQPATITWELLLDFLQLATFLLGLYIIFLLMVYLAMVLAKSLFGSIKHGKLIALISFFVLVRILDLLLNIWHFSNNSGFFVTLDFNIAANRWFILVALIVILFGFTGYLLDRKINL